MSAAKKFWIGVTILLTLIVGIKSPCTILVLSIIYFILSTAVYIVVVVIEQDDSEDYILSKYSLIYLLILSIKKFNNFLNSKFNKDD